MSNLISALKDAAATRLAAEKAAIETAKKTIKPLLQQFMQEHPSITALGWNQYTPYFNDGEACIFRVSDVYIADSTADLEDRYMDGEEGWYYFSERHPDHGAEITKEDYMAAGEIIKLLGSMETELQSVFGDHVKIVVTKDGVDVSDYDHD